MDNWKPIPSFPIYSVSDAGFVRNDDTDRTLAIRVTNRGVSYVGLMREGKQHNLSLARLVAEAYVTKPTMHGADRFNTPIHCNGHRDDNSADNLLWRPFWFASRFQQQFAKGPTVSIPVIDQKTDERYGCAFIAAMTFGLLEREIVAAITNRTFVWPTFQTFRFVEE